MRSRATFLLLLLVALPCLSIAKRVAKSSKPAERAAPPAKVNSGGGSPAVTNSGSPAGENSGSPPGENSGSPPGENSGNGNAAQMSSSEMVDMPPPPATQSTFSKIIDFIEGAVKETILPSDQDAYNELQGGVSPTTGPPGTSIQANADGGTTTGIVTNLEDLLNPLAQSLYLLIDSLLRSYEGKALPCIITSWVPLEGTCTPLTSSPNTNMPAPASSGPQPTR